MTRNDNVTQIDRARLANSQPITSVPVVDKSTVDDARERSANLLYAVLLAHPLDHSCSRHNATAISLDYPVMSTAWMIAGCQKIDAR